jgi:hypothetical protein
VTRTLGPFRLDGLLGEGAVGRVFRARHQASGELVALKVVWPHQRHLRSLVLREVDAVARLDHPGVVWVHDFGEDRDEGPWVALELLTGGALADRLPASWVGFSDLAQGLLAALGHAHAREVLHRDVKPANVLLGGPDDPRPGPKLVDFGIAAVGRGGGVRAATPDYAPPEQLRGDGADEGPWTDLFALGATLWHAACGGPPGRAPFEPRFAASPGLEGWLRWLLEPRAADRPANAARALAALRSLEPPAASDDSPRDTRTYDDAPEPARALRPHPRRSPASLRLFGLRPVPVAGRDGEQQALLRWVRGEGPPAAVVTGPAGVGKSHLLRWLAVHVRERDLGWVVPISLHRERPLVRGLSDARIPGLVVPATDALALEVLVSWAGTADRPVVALVDTVEGRPAGGIVSRLTGVPGLRVVSASRTRPEPLDRCLHLELGTVDPASLVRAIGVAEAGFAELLAQRTGGHPGHAVRMVADLVRSESLVPGRRGYTLAPGASLTFQEAPLEAARAVVSRLPASPALVAAAVLGPVVERGVWERVAARLGQAVDDAVVDEWVRAGAVRRTNGHLWFDDPLIRAALEASTSEGERRRIAAAAADETASSPERVVDHAEWTFAAGRLAEAAPKLVAAAVALRQPWTQDRCWYVLELAERALPAVAPAESEAVRVEVARVRGALLAQGGDVRRGLEVLDALVVSDPGLQRGVAFLAAQLELWAGRPERALARLPVDPPDGSVTYWPVRARIELEAGRPGEAAACLARAPRSVDAANERGMLALAERDPAALQEALVEMRALCRPGSVYPQTVEALGATLRLLELPLPLALDDALAATQRQRVPFSHLLLAVAAVLWAARDAPDELGPRLAAATEAIAHTGVPFRLVRELLAEAADAAPAERRAAVLELAAVAVPAGDGPR